MCALFLYIKAELEKKVKEEEFPKYLGILEKILCSNNGGNGFLVGSAVSGRCSQKHAFVHMKHICSQ